MLQKSKIRLSRHLHAQTTPYPEAKKWMRRSIIIAIVVLSSGIYLVARPHNKNSAEVQNREPKQILGEQEKAPDYINYPVKKGDTLFSLASQYAINWQTLADLNHLKEPYLLKTGQQIKIPLTK